MLYSQTFCNHDSIWLYLLPFRRVRMKLYYIPFTRVVHDQWVCKDNTHFEIWTIWLRLAYKCRCILLHASLYSSLWKFISPSTCFEQWTIVYLHIATMFRFDYKCIIVIFHFTRHIWHLMTFLLFCIINELVSVTFIS